MVIQNISAGLGKQIIIYAFGRVLSLRTGDSLYLDISYFKNKGLCDYGLANLSLSKDIKIMHERFCANMICEIKKKIYSRIIEAKGINNDLIEEIRPLGEKGYFYFTGRAYSEPIYAGKLFTKRNDIYGSVDNNTAK